MKKTLFLPLIVLIVTGFVSNAQGIHLGLKAGANATKIDGQTFSDGFKFAYHAGAFLEIGLGKHLAIQPELMFSQSKTQTVSNINQVTFPGNLDMELNYLSIPILLNIKPGKLVTIQVGPQFGILMNKSDNLTTSAQNAFKGGDFSMVGGLQLNLGTIKLYGRYVIGLNDVSDVSNESNWKSQQIQAGIGLKLF